MYNKNEDKIMEPINLGKIKTMAKPTGSKKIDSFEERLFNIIKDLKNRVEREVCEYGSFKNVRESISTSDPKDILKGLTIEIKPLPKILKDEVKNFEKLRYLELTGEGPLGQKESVILKRGTKEEILAKVKEEDFYNQILDKTKEFRISFLEN